MQVGRLACGLNLLHKLVATLWFARIVGPHRPNRPQTIHAHPQMAIVNPPQDCDDIVGPEYYYPELPPPHHLGLAFSTADSNFCQAQVKENYTFSRFHIHQILPLACVLHMSNTI